MPNVAITADDIKYKVKNYNEYARRRFELWHCIIYSAANNGDLQIPVFDIANPISENSQITSFEDLQISVSRFANPNLIRAKINPRISFLSIT